MYTVSLFKEASSSIECSKSSGLAHVPGLLGHTQFISLGVSKPPARQQALQAFSLKVSVVIIYLQVWNQEARVANLKTNMPHCDPKSLDFRKAPGLDSIHPFPHIFILITL